MEFVYDLIIDPDAENNTHAFALCLVGHNKSVLELGCATGHVTRAMVDRGCKVVGIELDAAAATVAETWAERVVAGDVDREEVWDSDRRRIVRRGPLRRRPRTSPRSSGDAEAGRPQAQARRVRGDLVAQRGAR